MSFHQGNPSAMEVPHQTHEWRNYVRTVPLPQGRPNATACASTTVTPAAQTTVSPLVSDTTEINSENNNVDFAYFDALPAGYRFCPHDEELIVHYLMKKVHGQRLPRNKIMEVNLYKHNPEELAEKFRRCGEKEWYFFTPRNKKYRNGSRPNRAAGDGYWKATGADKDVKYNGVKVGCRKALVFYLGRPPKGDKTNWIMHEFRVKDAPPLSPRDDRDDMMLDEWVLCKIYKKALKPNLRNQAADELEQAADELEQEQPDITDVPDDQVVTDADDHQNMDADFNTGDCPSLDQYFSFYQSDTLSPLLMDHHQKPPLPDSSASFSNHAQYENFCYCNEISPFDSGFTEADWTVMENQNDGPWMESVQNNNLSPNNPLN